MSSAQPVSRRRMSVATQVFIGLGLGLLVGLFFGERVAWLRVGGDVFIGALQITVIPYVTVALITSLGRLDLRDARNLALKAGSVLLLLWAIGLSIVFLAPLPFLFDLLRMPADLFQVFVTMDVIAARFGTLAAGMHIIALALIGSYAMQGRLRAS